jgi:hypothetical protein
MLRQRIGLAVVGLILACGPEVAWGFWHHGHGGGGSLGFGHGGSVGFGLGAVGYAGWGLWGPPVFVVPPTVVFLPPVVPGFGPPMGMAPRPVVRVANPGLPPPWRNMVRRPDPVKSSRLVTIGDRLFRTGNWKRAAERYQQAAAADPNAATPIVRLAQLAFVRGQYTEAANRFREAEATEPGWLVTAPDVQKIYGEPSDFAAPIAKLEAYLQAHPNDRDAWFVLGAQWFLSGRTQKAADVFTRLSDRRADPALAAFRDAATPDREEAAEVEEDR